MTKSNMILKMVGLAMLAGAATLPAYADPGVPLNGPNPNGLSQKGFSQNSHISNATNLHALTTNGGASSAASHAFQVRHGASGVDVNQLRLRAIVLPANPAR
jgi:hypothetical protein